MKRRARAAGDAVRQLPLISDERARLLSDNDTKQALFEEIIAMPTSTLEPNSTVSTRQSRRSRPIAALAAALATLAAAGTAWALFSSADTTATGCHIAEDNIIVIDAVTGDPVADCAAVWPQENGTPAPDLVAYETGNGGIAVVPRERSVPDGWTPLAPGVHQDPRLIRLETGLEDTLDGLKSDCYELPPARAIAERELRIAGLTDWEVVAERGQADGRRTCTVHILDAAVQRVKLVPVEGPFVGDSDAPHVRMAQHLRELIKDRCTTAGELADEARASAANTGVEQVRVHEQTDETLECASADMRVGGAVEVTVRGPAAR